MRPEHSLRIKRRWILGILVGITLFLGCGPDTIWLRPGLDTPSQHVSNGRQLLDRAKVDDAIREFKRARELDPTYSPAFVGLAIAMGRSGDMQGGLETLKQAERLAQTPEERDMVADGYRQLYEILQKKGSEPPRE
jgi:tetratricopeptide (TPR) repeat protein